MVDTDDGLWCDSDSLWDSASLPPSADVSVFQLLEQDPADPVALPPDLLAMSLRMDATSQCSCASSVASPGTPGSPLRHVSSARRQSSFKLRESGAPLSSASLQRPSPAVRHHQPPPRRQGAQSAPKQVRLEGIGPGLQKAKRKLIFRAESASPLLPRLSLTPLYVPWVLNRADSESLPFDQRRALLASGGHARVSKPGEPSLPSAPMTPTSVASVAATTEEMGLIHAIRQDSARRSRGNTPRAPPGGTSSAARHWKEVDASRRRVEWELKRGEKEEQRRCWRLERELAEAERERELRRQRSMHRRRVRERWEAQQQSYLGGDARGREFTVHHNKARSRRRFAQWTVIVPAVCAAIRLDRYLSENRAKRMIHSLFIPLLQKRLRRRCVDKTQSAAVRAACATTQKLTAEELKPLRLFSPWPMPLIQQLCSLFELKVFNPGEYVCLEDDPCLWFAVVSTGRITACVRKTRWQRELLGDHFPSKSRLIQHGQVLWTRGEGTHLPADCLVSGGATWPFSLYCESDVTLWTLAPSRMRSLLPQLPEDCQHMFQKMVADAAARAEAVEVTPESFSQAFPFLSETDWDESDIEAMLQLLEPAVFYEGQQIFDEGEIGNGLWFVRSGAVTLKHRPYDLAPPVRGRLGAAVAALAPADGRPPRPSISVARRPSRRPSSRQQQPPAGLTPTSPIRSPRLSFASAAVLKAQSHRRVSSRPSEGGDDQSQQSQSQTETREADVSLGPGAGFGEYSMLWQEPRSRQVVAQCTTLLLHLPRDGALDMLYSDPDRLADMQEVVSEMRDQRLWRPPKAMLRSSPILSHLSDKELTVLHRAALPLVLPPGETMIVAGDVQHFVFFFLTGGIEKVEESGGRGFFGGMHQRAPGSLPDERVDAKGMFLGLKEAFLDKFRWPETVKTFTRCDIWCLPSNLVVNQLWSRLGEDMFQMVRRTAAEDLGVIAMPPQAGSAPYMLPDVPDFTQRQIILKRHRNARAQQEQQRQRLSNSPPPAAATPRRRQSDATQGGSKRQSLWSRRKSSMVLKAGTLLRTTHDGKVSVAKRRHGSKVRKP
eukprot:TRINITY_DN21504_c0_g1_i1.p1 TRINITY_DN21504_c0_g1~~TRINITY_DN21504_c0_g1_i1.p1  ORF type:complete len:1072 (+),score=233.35 TRINITY_DN21504_c0_g1_i1:44-3217(+)